MRYSILVAGLAALALSACEKNRQPAHRAGTGGQPRRHRTGRDSDLDSSRPGHPRHPVRYGNAADRHGAATGNRCRHRHSGRRRHACPLT